MKEMPMENEQEIEQMSTNIQNFDVQRTIGF